MIKQSKDARGFRQHKQSFKLVYPTKRSDINLVNLNNQCYVIVLAIYHSSSVRSMFTFTIVNTNTGSLQDIPLAAAECRRLLQLDWR